MGRKRLQSQLSATLLCCIAAAHFVFRSRKEHYQIGDEGTAICYLEPTFVDKICVWHFAFLVHVNRNSNR